MWYMFYSDFVRPNCADSTIRMAISDDGSAWRAVNKNLLPGVDGEILKVDDVRWLMHYGPQGYFDSNGGRIHVATYEGELADLVE